VSILHTVLLEGKYGPGARGDEIPFITGPRWDHTDPAPSATPLADFLAQSYADEQTDAAGADAAVMSYEVWLETVGPWTFEPEPSYFEEVAP